VWTWGRNSYRAACTSGTGQSTTQPVADLVAADGKPQGDDDGDGFLNAEDPGGTIRSTPTRTATA
jgi:hypothetical protein